MVAMTTRMNIGVGPLDRDMVVGPQRIAFSCVLRAMRMKMSLFLWPVLGMDMDPAVLICLDSRGRSTGWVSLRARWIFRHGPSIGGDDLVAVSAILDNLKLQPFLDHLFDSRQRDIDNDGERNQARTNGLRTASIPEIWFGRQQLTTAIHPCTQACGQGTMETVDGPRVGCDWNNDGTPDIGGPTNRPSWWFTGGINTAVTAAILSQDRPPPLLVREA